jgi:hypothetical protein
MSTEKDPLEKQARNLVTGSSILSISLHRSFSQKSTEIERNFDKWEFYATIAGVYYGVAGLAVEVLPDRNRYDSLNAAIHEGLDVWNRDGRRALSDCSRVVNGELLAVQHADPETRARTAAASLGCWVLANVLSRKLSENEFDVAAQIGSMIIIQLDKWWS